MKFLRDNKLRFVNDTEVNEYRASQVNLNKITARTKRTSGDKP